MPKAGYKSRLLVGDLAIHSKLTEFENALNIDMHDVTVFKPTPDKDFIPGVDTSNLSASGFIDADTQTELATWTDSTPVLFGYEGLALGSVVELCAANQASYNPGSTVAGVASFDVSGQATGPSSFGVSLHDLTAATSDESGTAHDGTAATSAGGWAQLHVTAFSGFSGAVVIVEDSATGSSGWATIATFATAAGTTSERVAVAGAVRRYLRYSIDVTGTGSITFAVGFARN